MNRYNIFALCSDKSPVSEHTYNAQHKAISRALEVERNFIRNKLTLQLGA